MLRREGRDMTRWLVNFLIGAIWVLVFNAFGWLRLEPHAHVVADPTLATLIDAGVIAVVIVVMGEVASVLYIMFVVATLGLGCLLLPIYWLLVGYFKLWLAASLLPGWFTYSHNLICVLIMSWVLGAGRWAASGEIRRREVSDPNEVKAEWHVEK